MNNLSVNRTETMITTPRRCCALVARACGMLVAAALATGAASLATAHMASASTAPVTYSAAHDACTTISPEIAYIDMSRPISVTHYTGTTYLYWTAEVQVFLSGRWQNFEGGESVYAHIWGYHSDQLTPIYWGDISNNYGAAFAVPVGYHYRTVGYTYWWNGSSWFASNATVVDACNF